LSIVDEVKQIEKAVKAHEEPKLEVNIATNCKSCLVGAINGLVIVMMCNSY